MTEVPENVGTMALQLLPEQLLQLSLRDLETSAALCTAAAERGIATIGDLLALPAASPDHWLDPESAESLRAAIARRRRARIHGFRFV